MSHLLLSLLLLLSATVADPTPAPAENGTTVYDLLAKYGLPPGLLPDSVTAFSLSKDGAFEVELPGTCYIQFEYLIQYAPKITGVIKYGGIQNLKGIQVRRLVWFDVDAIRVDIPPAENIYFQVGLINKQLDVAQFRTVHSCKKDTVAGRVRAAAKDLLRLPESVREIEMLLTE